MLKKIGWSIVFVFFILPVMILIDIYLWIRYDIIDEYYKNYLCWMEYVKRGA